MLPTRLTGWASSVRVEGPGALGLRQGYPGYYSGGDRARRSTTLPSRTDQLDISPGARTLSRLLLTWGALSSLFGVKQPEEPGLGLAALREALAAARKAAQEARGRQGVIDTLKSSVLAQAEALVEQYYGLRADGAPLRVVIEQDMGGVLAAVSYQYDRQGRAANQELHISLSQFTPDTSANGVNQHLIENDRIIAHEMTHAIMGRAMEFSSLPPWFVEGTAEYIAGAMERVASLHRLSPRQLIDRVGRPWEGDSPQYAAAYIAVRYLDQATVAGGGLKAIMQRLKSGDHLDQAITAVSDGTVQGERGFLAAFLAQGVAFLQSLDTSGRDPGSIKPARGADVVSDRGNRADQPLRGFRVQWRSPLEGAFPLSASFGFTPTSTAFAAYRRQR